jgi:hypothetical protein
MTPAELAELEQMERRLSPLVLAPHSASGRGEAGDS